MDALISWILFTEAGDITARTVMALTGLGIWANLMLLATYLPRDAVPVWVALLIVLGVGMGVGAVHSGVMGNLLHGAVYVSAASGIVMALLIGVVGTPRQVSARYCVPIDRRRWWSVNVMQPVATIKERVSNWGDLPASTTKPRKRKD